MERLLGSGRVFGEGERPLLLRHARVEAAPAARLVHPRGADDDPFPRGDEALRAARGRAAEDADRARLDDLLGESHEGGHRLERPAEVVLVEAGDDDALAEVGQACRDLDDSGVEELGLVDPDDLRPVVRPGEDLRRGRDGAPRGARLRNSDGEIEPFNSGSS